MLVISESIDGGNVGMVGKINHVLLVKGPNDRAVDHATKDPRGVLDGLPTTKLNIVFGKEHDISAQLANADFKGDAGAGGRFCENDGPSLTRKWLDFVGTAVCLHLDSEIDEKFELLSAGFFDG